MKTPIIIPYYNGSERLSDEGAKMLLCMFLVVYILSIVCFLLNKFKYKDDFSTPPLVEGGSVSFMFISALIILVLLSRGIYLLIF